MALQVQIAFSCVFEIQQSSFHETITKASINDRVGFIFSKVSKYSANALLHIFIVMHLIPWSILRNIFYHHCVQVYRIWVDSTYCVQAIAIACRCYMNTVNPYVKYITTACSYAPYTACASSPAYTVTRPTGHCNCVQGFDLALCPGHRNCMQFMIATMMVNSLM